MQQLRHFWSIAEHGNLLRAAKALNLTQPALSRSIKALETQLQVRLFDRSPRGVTLTPFGVEFLKHARVILNEQQRAVLSLNALRNGRNGHINVGVGHSFASSLLPQAIVRLLEFSPGVSIRVREGYFEELVGLLRTGEIDLALSLMPDGNASVDDLVIQPLIELRSEIVANANHPATKKSKASLAELAEARWLLQDQAHATRSFLEIFERGDIAPPKVIIKTTSMSFLRGMLAVSDFMALIADQLVAAELASGSLKIVKTDLPGTIRRGGAIYRAFGTTPPAVKALIAKLQAVCRANAVV